jgi:hypothetical protein
MTINEIINESNVKYEKFIEELEKEPKLRPVSFDWELLMHPERMVNVAETIKFFKYLSKLKYYPEIMGKLTNIDKKLIPKLCTDRFGLIRVINKISEYKYIEYFFKYETIATIDLYIDTRLRFLILNHYSSTTYPKFLKNGAEAPYVFFKLKELYKKFQTPIDDENTKHYPTLRDNNELLEIKTQFEFIFSDLRNSRYFKEEDISVVIECIGKPRTIDKYLNALKSFLKLSESNERNESENVSSLLYWILPVIYPPPRYTYFTNEDEYINSNKGYNNFKEYRTKSFDHLVD